MKQLNVCSKVVVGCLSLVANNIKRENWGYDDDDDAIEALGLDFLLDCGDR